MNMAGWLGGGAAPLVVGYIAWKANLGLAIATAALAYVAGGIFLLTGIVFFVRRDVARMNAQIAATSGFESAPAVRAALQLLLPSRRFSVGRSSESVFVDPSGFVSPGLCRSPERGAVAAGSETRYRPSVCSEAS